MALKRTAKGNVKADSRKEHATLSGGRFPIDDKRSADAALKLRGHAHSQEEKNKIEAKAAKFDKAAAAKARKADKKK